MEKFWSVNSVGNAIEKEILKRNQVVAMGIKSFLIMDILTTIGMMVCAAAVSGHRLPVTLYHVIDFTRTDYYILAFVWFTIFGYQVTLFLIGFDGLFVTLITSATSQLRMLNTAITHLNSEDANMKQIERYVEHHIFVIR